MIDDLYVNLELAVRNECLTSNMGNHLDYYLRLMADGGVIQSVIKTHAKENKNKILGVLKKFYYKK